MSEWPLIFSSDLKVLLSNYTLPVFLYDSKVNGEYGLQYVRQHHGVLNFAALSFGLEAQVAYLNN